MAEALELHHLVYLPGHQQPDTGVSQRDRLRIVHLRHHALSGLISCQSRRLRSGSVARVASEVSKTTSGSRPSPAASQSPDSPRTTTFWLATFWNSAFRTTARCSGPFRLTFRLLNSGQCSTPEALTPCSPRLRRMFCARDSCNAKLLSSDSWPTRTTLLPTQACKLRR